MRRAVGKALGAAVSQRHTIFATKKDFEPQRDAEDTKETIQMLPQEKQRKQKRDEKIFHPYSPPQMLG
jgi:hypothetical protein